MNSKIQKIAGELQSLSSETSFRIMSMQAALREVDALTARAQACRAPGVDTRPLIEALRAAGTSLRRAAEDAGTAQTLALGFSASLADGTRGGGSTPLSAAPTTIAAPATASADGDLRRALDSRGFELVDVSEFDLDENPITDWKHASEADTRWGVERWNDQIAPALAAGATREDLDDYDRRNNAGDWRRLANVWDMFLGSDPIVSSGRNASGKLIVGSGRHRIQAAINAGVRFLPVKKR